MVIPRSRDWAAIDKTDEYSGTQRKACKTAEGKECTVYPFPAGMKVIEMFKPKRWLDPTAGWGDRLRVAIASDVEYVGVDSNRSMQSAYKAIVEDLAEGDHKKFKVKEGKFQEVPIPGKFDLVFTSPPFYTKEIYEDMKIWESPQDFMDDFLRPLFAKSYRHLKKGGHIVLYIEDTGVESFIPLMKDMVATDFPGLAYEGAFYYEGSRLRPYYVWKKTTEGMKTGGTRKRSKSTFKTRKQK